jgi:pyruvate dehydrogenase E1 component
MDDLGDQGDVTALIDARSDEELAALMENLGGNCVETMAEAFAAIDHDRPTCFLAYTIKGWGTPIAGAQGQSRRADEQGPDGRVAAHMGVPEGEEWEKLATVKDRTRFRRSSTGSVLRQGPAPLHRRDRCPCPPSRSRPTARSRRRPRSARSSTTCPRATARSADRIVTTSPDVTGTTNLGPWVNRRKLFARDGIADTFIEQRIPSTAEMGVHTRRPAYRAGHRGDEPVPAAGAAGLSHSLFGKRLIPIGTVYDPLVARGLDALNYACYQDARFMIVGTPSGVTLAPEGGAHQSIGSPLIGMSQDGLAAFEPAFADELAVIMEWAFDYMQRDGEGDPDERTWLRDETGGSVYLGSPPTRSSSPARRGRRGFPPGRDRRRLLAAQPGPNCEVVIAYQGVVAPEAIKAAGRIAETSARCRRSGRHLGRPAERRLDRGAAGPRPGQPLGPRAISRR